MAFQPASTGSLVAFGTIIAAVLAALLIATRHAYRATPGKGRSMQIRAAAITLAWLGLLSALVASGQMQRLPLSGLPVFFGAVLASGLAVGFSRFGGRLAAGLPIPALVGFQSFRLPLELVLHRWAESGTIPHTMSWTGQNWDILSGFAALLAMPWSGRSRAVAWLANTIGFVLLINVVRVALLSSPVPFGWNVSPPLVLALHWPYALIGPVCVAGALAGHIVLTRALLRNAR